MPENDTISIRGTDPTAEDSDGYAEAWYLPDAANIPAGYARTGTFFDYFNAKRFDKIGYFFFFQRAHWNAFSTDRFVSN